jgi:hypothetical protein
MTPVRPDPDVKPLSSKTLAEDAAAAGADPEPDVLRSEDAPGSDPHLPASESDELAKEDRWRTAPEREITLLPPD